MGREWLFKENPFDLIKKIENAVYTCSPALKHRQAGLLLPLVHPACLCSFISTGRFWGLEIMQLPHGLHGHLQLAGFFGWLAPTWESSSVKTVFTNILIAVIDSRWRQICLQSCFFFFSKWLRTASAYVLSPPWSSSFSLSCSWSCLFLLVCAFHHCLSSIYFSLHISVSFPAVGGSIGSKKSVAEQLEEPSKP